MAAGAPSSGESDPVATLGAVLDAMTVVADDAGHRALVDRLVAIDRPTTLAFVNAHACNLAASKPGFCADLLAADIRLRDGKGMEILFRRLGIAPGLNLNGTDLIPLLIERFRGRPIAILGTAEPWLSGGAARVAETSPVVVCLDGFQSDEQYVAALQKAPADLIILAMGMPKQERVAAKLHAALPRPCLIVCGGAIIDFLAGRFSRAPEWMRATGLEWVYRLALEPRRLFQRYVVGNAFFLTRTERLARVRRRRA